MGKVYRQNFISHMVQMKDVVKNVPKYGDRDFISHMVQMKGALGCDKVGCDRNLYIPHGSDERGFK